MSFRSLVLLALGPLAGCGDAPVPAAPVAPAPAPAPGAWPLALVPAAEPAPAFERVVLVTLDTLRADHVSSYGYPRATTPFLDSLAARGVRFTQALAAVSHTAPSHATMLTGLVPAVHGVVHNGGELPQGALDLARRFGSAGFATGAFLNVKFLSGIASSFQTSQVVAVGEVDGKRRPLDGEHVVDAALAWLAREKPARYFLWVHLYDPHKWKDVVIERWSERAALWTGASPPDFFERVLALHGLPAPLPGSDYHVDWRVERDSKAGTAVLEVNDRAGFLACIDAYDERTLYADRQLARLHAAVEASGAGRTLWIVTADHGEGLASHGVAGHGGRIYQEQLRVPLVVHASDGSLAPRVVDAPVAHVDLFPTLVATLGDEVHAAPVLYDGRSLWPLLTGTETAWPARTLFAQRRPAENDADPDSAAVFALQDGRHKFILHEPGADELYDLAADPLERADLGPEAAVGARLRAELEQRLRVYGALAPGAEAGEVPEEWLEELRDLGYVR